jgi:pilus assembly protein Flp/PilA
MEPKILLNITGYRENRMKKNHPRFTAAPLNRAMKKLVRDFLINETGATAIEYGLIAAGISLAIIVMINTLGTTLNTKFTSINSKIK